MNANSRTVVSIRSIAVSAVVFAASVCAQTTMLDTVCLVDDASKLLQLAQLAPEADSLSDSFGFDLDSLKVRGTCDSVQIGYETDIFGTSIFVPLVTMTKLNSCSLSLSYLVDDTVINTCEPFSSIEAQPHRVLEVAQSQLRGFSHDGKFVVQWDQSQTRVSRISFLDVKGRMVKSIENPAGDHVALPFTRTSFSFVAVVELVGGTRVSLFAPRLQR